MAETIKVMKLNKQLINSASRKMLDKIEYTIIINTDMHINNTFFFTPSKPKLRMSCNNRYGAESNNKILKKDAALAIYVLRCCYRSI